MSAPTVYTIGHVAHPQDALFGLLRHHGIEVVVDVRSSPYSKHSPHLSKRPLERGLQAQGIGYTFEGEALGGRLAPEYVSPGGEPDYTRRALAPDFVAGIELVLGQAANRSVALLCGEEDPRRCHRWLLVGRALAARECEVLHIRADGAVEQGEVLEQEATRQLELF
jgi:uncharacterized protein (DUF488 family)